MIYTEDTPTPRKTLREAGYRDGLLGRTAKNDHPTYQAGYRTGSHEAQYGTMEAEER